MNCQNGTRRCATWDEIEDAPQIKRLREEKVQENTAQNSQRQPATPQKQQQQQQQAPNPPPQQNAPPKFYISAPIQGFTVNNEGGCRYLFF